MTPKQKLAEHIATMHGGVPVSRMTTLALADWHSRQHHRFATNHFHEGPNTGPGDRPPGWRTGEGAVART